MRRSISPPPIIEDPVSILPGITQFLSKQITTLARGALQQPPHPSNAPEIIEAMGFRCDVHKVTTDDGYILTMHRWTDRLPGEVSIFFRLGEGVGPVVFLQHGLLCSSVDWVLGARDKALGWCCDDRDESECE